jgi:hypothetical protein
MANGLTFTPVQLYWRYLYLFLFLFLFLFLPGFYFLRTTVTNRLLENESITILNLNKRFDSQRGFDAILGSLYTWLGAKPILKH